MFKSFDSMPVNSFIWRRRHEKGALKTTIWTPGRYCVVSLQNYFVPSKQIRNSKHRCNRPVYSSTKSWFGSALHENNDVKQSDKRKQDTPFKKDKDVGNKMFRHICKGRIFVLSLDFHCSPTATLTVRELDTTLQCQYTLLRPRKV